MTLPLPERTPHEPVSRSVKEAKREPEPAPRSRWRRILFWLIVAQMVAVLAAIGAMLVAEDTRLTFIALYAPRLPLLGVTVLALALTPLTRRRVRALAAVQLALCLVVVFPVMGLHLGWSRKAEGKELRIASYNVYFGKMNRPALMQEIDDLVHDNDIMLIQAPHESMAARLRERFPDRRVEWFEDFVIVTRLPIRELIKPKPFTEDVHAMYAGYVFDTEAGPLVVYNVHPYSPRHGLFSDEMDTNIDNREKQIDAAVEAAKATAEPWILVGDTNLPPLSGIGRRRLSGLKDAFEDVGFGFGYTFPSKYPWMRIDRAFGSDAIRFLDFEIGRRGESDHRSISFGFEIKKR